MIDRALSLIAPHICCSCGRENALLCENCIFDIIDEPFLQCVACSAPTAGDNLCSPCRLSLMVAACWVVGERQRGLKTLINEYKFNHAHEATTIIARLLDERLPVLAPDTVLCYVPDIPAHRRQRGHDHMAQVAKAFARRRKLSCEALLVRQTSHSQRGLTRAERLRRQKGAFLVNKAPNDSPVLLIDDIYTTGATLSAGVDALRAAGVGTIYTAIVARQPLDHSGDL